MVFQPLSCRQWKLTENDGSLPFFVLSLDSLGSKLTQQGFGVVSFSEVFLGVGLFGDNGKSNVLFSGCSQKSKVGRKGFHLLSLKTKKNVFQGKVVVLFRTQKSLLTELSAQRARLEPAPCECGQTRELGRRDRIVDLGAMRLLILLIKCNLVGTETAWFW